MKGIKIGDDVKVIFGETVLGDIFERGEVIDVDDAILTLKTNSSRGLKFRPEVIFVCISQILYYYIEVD